MDTFPKVAVKSARTASGVSQNPFFSTKEVADHLRLHLPGHETLTIVDEDGVEYAITALKMTDNRNLQMTVVEA